MTDWNLADCLDIVAEVRGDQPALIQGEKTVSWRQFHLRAQSIAAWLLDAGVTHQGKVAMYSYNDNAYLEASYGCIKASLVPVNINYRYKEQELLYLFTNSDTEAVVVHQDFVPALVAVLPQLPEIKAVLVIGELEHSAFPPAVLVDEYETIAISSLAPKYHTPRSGEDMIFIYTGGTTGMPKGVMWRQRDLYQTLGGGTVVSAPASVELFRAFVQSPPKMLNALILPPLMHGTAFFSSIVALLAGGAVLLTRCASGFDPAEVWSIVEDQKPNVINIVGDTFARPLLEELERKHYDITSIDFVASAGTLWSSKIKAGFLKYHPKMRLFDGLGSSEAHNIGIAVTTIDNIDNPTPRFIFNTTTVLLDDSLKPLDIKPGVKGMIAVCGARPAGYYKDDSKSEQTFIDVGDRKCALSGDWAQVNEDGETFTLLGRGSVCINTGGEKVYPEEVEGVIKQFDGISDAVVVGVPDERWGEAIVAVASSDNEEIDEKALIAFVKSKLANYKAPKHIVAVTNVYRAPSGKADYKETKRVALKKLGIS